MAKKKVHVVRTFHTAARSRHALFVLPVLQIPAVVLLLREFNERLTTAGSDQPVEPHWYIISVVGLLLLPLWAKIHTFLFTRYRVTLDSVVEQQGLFSRHTSEIRIADIRNVVVNQSMLDRIVLIGDVSFSSAAGSGIEVTFRKIARPGRVRDLVKDIQDRISDGTLSADDIAAIRAEADPKLARRERKRAALAAQAENATSATTPAAEKEPVPRESGSTPAANVATSAGDSDAADDDATASDDAGPGTAAKPSPATEGDAPEKPASGDTGTPTAGAASTPAADDSAPAADKDGDTARDELYRLLAQQAAEGKAEE